jgi:hypothetical protein
VFVLGKHFLLSLMFVGKARSLLLSRKLEDASLGQAPALHINIRLGWKGLPGTNTVAYSENLQITAVKSFIVQAPGVSM